MVTNHEPDVEARSRAGIEPRRKRRSFRRKILWSVIVTVGIFVAVVAGVTIYFLIREHQSPSGRVFVNTSQGKVELHVPDTMATPPTPPVAAVIPDAPSPPTTIDIPSIGLHAGVYLMTSMAPKTRAVGWLYGTAMPGTTGNMVFYGARAGPAAVFDHLDQIHKGDEIAIGTGAITYVYRAESEREVDASNTDVMLPTSNSTLTLITDAGAWDPSIRGYTRRLVVQATYESAKP